ncbi:MAG: CDP-alcohol phosphatidyltransferase family protein [Actinomycetota bacterium]|nr:CDP-alcohol phosphatidyltransferase family protein [Actinomycetota bacterium]
MLNRYARAFATRAFTPAARALLRAGVSPDVVTLVGTLGVCTAALGLYPRGHFFWGTIAVALFALSDTVDGTMARVSGRPSRWGAFLDSTLDRVADGAIFAGLVLWFAGRGADLLMAALALYCLVTGSVVPYAKARAESLGMSADVGIAERADRVVVVLLATGLAGIGVPYVQAAALWLLAAAATVTVAQRMLVVRRQALLPVGAEGAAG